MATSAEPATTLDRDPAVEEGEPVREVYDRSSLTGDYMVMIAGQTPEDFELYAPESRFCDFIDGVVYMPSPATDRHQELTGFLFVLLNLFGYERKIGLVLLGPAVLRLSENWKPEPDVFVRPDVEAGQPHAPALLVIEVLSRSTRDHDLGRKLATYQAAGVPEIWLCDDRDRAVIVERREGDQYCRERLTEGRLNSSSLPGFWINVAWLWESRLPNPRACLEMILAASPA